MTLNLKHRLFQLSMLILTVSVVAQSQSEKPGINTSYMDLKSRPNDNFFRFVNGTWLDNTEIPSDRTRWGSFDELRQNTDKDVLNILKIAVGNPAYGPTTDQGKAVSLYKSFLDTETRNKQGVQPLKPYLAKIDAVKNLKDLQKLLIEMEPIGGLGFFGVGVGTDAKNSNRHIAMVGPGRLGLPDQDYYLSNDADPKQKREAYVKHVARMLQFIGEKPALAQANAEKVLALETAMSKPQLTRVERRDRRKTYNPMSMLELQKLTPTFDWNNYLMGIGLPKLDTVVVSQPKYMVAINEIFNTSELDSWKAYMRWMLINNHANSLSTEIDAADFDFFGKTMTGAIQQRPLEDRALKVVDNNLGDAVGKLYVEQKFPPEAKEKALAMIRNIFVAFENRINKLPWMTPATRKNAIEKLHKSRIKIGYPDKWEDYSQLTIVSPEKGGTYFDNLQRISRWEHIDNMADINKPVDKEEWGTPPQTVNAYYSASTNSILFPAGILQPPFYDYRADEAVNYGGIGAVIGHEISHGFDDSGSRYNADGNLINWWSDEDLKQFTTLGDALANQYSALEPLPGIFVDGKFTLGENIGDLGGVNAAYDGLQLHLAKTGNPGPIDGYTPDQRFFISWATIWRTKARDEALKSLVKTDSHSPGMYRAYVPLQNIDAFYKAFNIKKGDGMYLEPENRIRIW